MDTLSEGRLRAALAGVETGFFGAQLHYYPQLGSTNDRAKQLAEQQAPAGTLVIADEQTEGRGRLGRRWESPPGAGLLLSVLFRPVLPPDQTYRLVMACGLAVAEACEAQTGVSVWLKWPNDLLLGDKKLAGILAESALIGDQLAWCVVGMGVNVNRRFEASDPLFETATSLLMAVGRVQDRAVLLAGVVARLQAWHARLHDPALLAAWQRRCVTLGQRVGIQTPDGTLEGLAEQIDPTGALWLREDSGQLRLVAAGDATVLSGRYGRMKVPASESGLVS